MMLYIIFFILVILLALLLIIITKNRFNKLNIGGSQNNLEKNNATNKFGTNKNATAMQAQSAVMRYTISGYINGLDYSQLRDLLSQYFIEKPITDKVTISIGSYGYFNVGGKIKCLNHDPLFIKQQAAIKNTLEPAHQLINKSDLYTTIKKLIPNGIKYLPKSYNIKEFEAVIGIGGDKNNLETKIFDHPYIFKQNATLGQKGVKVITNMKEYYHAKKELGKYEKNALNNTNKKPDDAIISEYIINPRLIDDKKFHFRIYVFLSIECGIKRCYIHNEYMISTALKPYVKGDWLNHDIHITGGKTTMKYYKWPDAVWGGDMPQATQAKFNHFKKVLATAIALNNIMPYTESYIGYFLYAVDVIVTEDDQFFILEINNKVGLKAEGFGFKDNKNEAEEFSRRFSRDFFSFVLDHIIYPPLGIKRRLPPLAEVIIDGVLSPFSGILTGIHMCTLIPLSDATEAEITKVKHIHFFNKVLLFENIINEAKMIYLIGRQTNEIIGRQTNEIIGRQTNEIIGYLVLNKENHLKIAIKEEFQNRGIATAMIAQFVEVCITRNFTNPNHFTLYIAPNNEFLSIIAEKLQFKKNAYNKYEKIIKPYNNYYMKSYKHILTYKLIHSNNDDLFEIAKYMKPSNSQFISFIYQVFTKENYSMKFIIGSKYNKNFIYQGSELKSSLDIKILYNIYLFFKWSYDLKMENNIIFNDGIIVSSINELQKFSQNDNLYNIFNYKNRYHKVLTIDEIKKEMLNEEEQSDFLISRYYPPYLLDNNLLKVRFFLLLYVAANGVIKCHCFNEILAFDKNMKKYNWPNDFKTGELSHIANDKSILSNFIKTFLYMLIQYDIKPFPESNSGFLEFIVDVQFLQMNELNYSPNINKINNWARIEKNTIMDDAFIEKYYQWVNNCVILPHFGLLKHNHFVKPITGCMAPQCFKKIEWSIISELLLEFHSERTHVDVYYMQHKIGHIHLDLSQLKNLVIEMTHIEIDAHHRKTNLSNNIVFLLMETLAAYYAPMNISLMFKYIKQMHTIAYDLEFNHIDDYYIRKCR